MLMETRSMIGSAPAKIILFGEHAVVYGYPAIAAPISSLRVTASSTSNNGYGLRIFSDNFSDDGLKQVDLSASDISDAFALTVKKTLHFLRIEPPDIDIRISSQIPVASGLGSGAAVSTAIVRLLVGYARRNIPLQDLNKIIFETEKIHHATPSGIDNTVIVYEKAIYYVRNKPIELLQLESPLQFIVANTGIPAPTKTAVQDVGKLVTREPDRYHPILKKIGYISEQAKLALTQGNLPHLGSLMSQNHKELRKITVSSDELDHFVAVAAENGALGAKLSGGGRGGNMIALVEPGTRDRVKDALAYAGATDVFVITVEQ
jgi:mevalonate kinase